MNLVGKVLADRYEIRAEIGKGGMAQVYKAWCNLLNRWVAIKVLKEEFKDDKEFVRRFNVEAQAAACISNPHVVSIYDVGFESGLYYIVMEYIEGITLKEYIAEKGCLPWREAAGFAAQICEGLAAAHRANVVHRDIKPQNIIMTKEGVLKVTDFGIARASTQATMTMGGHAIGTVHYLSPEQARGGYTDQRTDIYSLGVVLYEMLTGKLPFTDESPVAVAIKHIQEAPKPLREWNPEIPPAMEKVTLRAMEKEQSRRYATAEAFLDDINRVLDNPNCDVSEKTPAPPKEVAENMDSTIKIDPIDDQAIVQYQTKKKKPQTKSGTKEKKKAAKAEQETEERELREISERRRKREQKKKERRITWIAILAAVLVVALLGCAFVAMTGGFGFTGSDKIEIPNLIDMDLEKAQRQYKDDFSIVKKSERQSDKAVGAILEQSPEAGKKVQKRSDLVIYVVVSAGSNASNMENYVGMESAAAQAALKSGGFQVNVIEQASDSVEKGHVFAQEPVAGSAISQGGLVTLYVSKGADAAKETATASATATASTAATEKPKASEKPTKEPEEKAEPTEKPAKTTTPTKTPSEGGSGTSTGGSNQTSGGQTDAAAPGIGD